LYLKQIGMPTTSPKISLLTLGCAKNVVDSERMLGLLRANDYEFVEDPVRADIVIVNTCGFIGPAKEESIDAIMEVARHSRKLIVTGCMAERYRNELEEELTEADRILGLADECDIVQHCDELLDIPRSTYRTSSRQLLTPSHWAYLRIADGCDHRCSFCAIPSIKGRYRSEPMEELIQEAADLVRRGIRELILVAQDTTRYGADLYGASRLTDLLRSLSEIPDLRWIRLMYTYPGRWDDELIECFAHTPKLCRYVDIPLQHISDRILRRMRRGTTSAQIQGLIERLRRSIPGVALRTAFIVGFPGETDAEFEELLAFVENTRFERLGAFAYSQEEGTAAAEHEEQVSEEIKEERLRRLMTLQQRISAETGASQVGRRIPVLIDREDESGYVGRTEWDAPDVDGEVWLEGENLSAGEVVEVEITNASEYDLTGETVGRKA